MSKYKIGDVVYAVTTVSAETKAQCKVCGGEGKAFFKNGTSVDCDNCTEGQKTISYRRYEASPTPIRIQGVREFTGIETKYYSEGEWQDEGFYGSLLSSIYRSFGKDVKLSERYHESSLFPTQREAEQAANIRNHKAENEALEDYWKSENDDNDY